MKRDLELEKEKLEESISHLELVKNQAMVALEAVQEEIEQEKKELVKLIKESDLSEEELKTKEKRVQMFVNLIEDYQETAKKALQTKAEVEIEVRELLEARDALEVEIEAKKAGVKMEVDKAFKQSEKQLIDIQAKVKEATKNLNTVDGQIVSLERTKQSLTISIEELNDKVNKLKGEIKSTETRLMEIAPKLDNANNKLEAFALNEKSLKEKQEVLLKNIEDINRTKEEARKELTKTITELESKRGEVIDITRGKLALAEEKRTLAMKVENIKKLYEEAGLPWTD